jgi:hypothetical protein
MVSFAPGVVTNIAPRDPETEAALAVGRKGTLVDTLNELARVGYRLAPASNLLGQTPTSGQLLMERVR